MLARWSRPVKRVTFRPRPVITLGNRFMRCVLAFLALAVSVEAVGAQPSERDFARARRILATTPLIDGHNDLAWAIRRDSVAPMNVAAYDLRKRTRGHTDLARLAAGMVGGQFWAVYIPGEIADSGFARVQLEQ